MSKLKLGPHFSYHLSGLCVGEIPGQSEKLTIMNWSKHGTEVWRRLKSRDYVFRYEKSEEEQQLILWSITKNFRVIHGL